jgi:hypothetical protein
VVFFKAVHVATSERKPDNASRRAFAGLLVRKERWALSLKGKLIIFFAFLASVVGVVYGTYPFLAQNHPRSRELLVIEGWMPTYVIKRVAQYANERDYQRVVIARALYPGRNQYESGEFVANYVAESLTELGVPKDRVQLVSQGSRPACIFSGGKPGSDIPIGSRGEG